MDGTKLYLANLALLCVFAVKSSFLTAKNAKNNSCRLRLTFVLVTAALRSLLTAVAELYIFQFFVLFSQCVKFGIGALFYDSTVFDNTDNVRI